MGAEIAVKLEDIVVNGCVCKCNLMETNVIAGGNFFLGS